MREEKFHIYLNDDEYSRMIQSLIRLKNSLISQGRYTDGVDDVLCKVMLYGKCLPRLSAERIYRYCSYLAGFPCGAFETGRAGSKGNRPCYRAVYSRLFEYLRKADQC